MKTILAEALKYGPLGSLIIGVVLVVLAAVNVLPYGGERIPIDPGWRYFLAALGLVLAGIGTYGWIRETSRTGGTIKIDLKRIRGEGANW